MLEINHSSKIEYTKDIATTYESDRKDEKIWQLEQAYISKVVEKIPTSSFLLDLPVGTGRFLDFYQSKKISVVGLDISKAMLEEAQTKVYEPTIKLTIGDVMDLKYPDGTFTHLICFRLLHLIPPEKLSKVLNELSRVTTGTFYIQAYVKDNWLPFLKLKFKLLEIINKIIRVQPDKKTLPWGKIQSFNHEKKILIKLFESNDLELQQVHSLGSYGVLSNVVFVLINNKK